MNSIAFLAALFVFCCLSSPVLAFGERSHQRITEEALHQINLGDELPWDAIMEGCTYPDERENDGGSYFGHFFDPEKDTSSGDNALSRMLGHYRKARNAYNRRQRRQAGHELGQALHYMQDMCSPVHIWGYAFNILPPNLAVHSTYEKVVDDVNAYTFLQYRPSEAMRNGMRGLASTAIHHCEKAGETKMSQYLRRITSKDTPFLGFALGLNPGYIAGVAFGARNNVDPSCELDRPLKASCDVIYQFCQDENIDYRIRETNGRVLFA